MNLRDIAETAVTVAWFGQHQSENDAVSQSFLKEFWRSARLRCHLWHQDHIRYCKQEKRQDSIALLEEVVVSELLTRVILTLIASDDPAKQIPFGQRVIEHEHKVKKMIVRQCYRHKEDIAERLRLERFQRRVERWIDLLLSPYRIQERFPYAVNSVRCEEFAEQTAFQHRLTSPPVELSVFLSSARLTIPNREITIPTRRTVLGNMLNQSLALIPSKSCDAHGVLPRLLNVVSD